MSYELFANFKSIYKRWTSISSETMLNKNLFTSSVKHLECASPDTFQRTGSDPGFHYVDVTHHSYRYPKRLIDIAVSVTALFILSLPFLFFMLLVYIDDPGPVFFRQNRIGLNGKPFRIFKFRTMKTNTPKYLSTRELREIGSHITRVGRFFRRFSIDELPQFINVLLGDMSLVGPRPLIAAEYEIHNMRTQYGVYNVRPGITGLAQINGRDTVSAVEKVHFDIQYLEEFGPWMDLKILFITIPKMISASGVYEGDNPKSNKLQPQ